MKSLISTCLLYLAVISLTGCAGQEKAVTLHFRDAVTQEPIGSGSAIIQQRISYFSKDPVGHVAEIKPDGQAYLRRVKEGSWAIRADAPGYDAAWLWFSFDVDKDIQRPAAGQWETMMTTQQYPNIPDRAIEFQMEITEPKR
ncbi:hypothetical protein [Cerasicoccus maritimus]|uniref:hypothetical protein n=1 Tax=Cerasicoccus maritimus TaxID=490089 RepID=UPI002852923B|nr:hypothetical protein [Cerasicoccus maritimus]